MNYYLKATSCKNFIVEKDDQQLYHLDTNWMLTKAKAAFKKDNLTIHAINFWASKFDITYDGNFVGKLKLNWKSHGVLNLMNEYGDSLRLTLKRRGIFKHRYEVFKDDKSQAIITLYAKRDWFKTNYDVFIHEVNFGNFPMSILIGILGFVANKVRQRNQGG